MQAKQPFVDDRVAGAGVAQVKRKELTAALYVEGRKGKKKEERTYRRYDHEGEIKIPGEKKREEKHRNDGRRESEQSIRNNAAEKRRQ